MKLANGYTTLNLLLLFGLAACGGTSAVREEAARTEAVLEAVFLFELSQFARPQEPPLRVCLEVTSRTGTADPSPELLRRLQEKVQVRGRSECAVQEGGVVHAESSQPAVLIGAGPITWREADEATVPGRYFRSQSASALPVYRVVQEAGQWVCLGPIIEGLPL